MKLDAFQEIVLESSIVEELKEKVNLIFMSQKPRSPVAIRKCQDKNHNSCRTQAAAAAVVVKHKQCVLPLFPAIQLDAGI